MRKIFVPFISGTLNYDCKECGYRCCQYGDILMNMRERTMLLEKYQFLRYFFFGKTAKTYKIHKYPTCWFLESSGACQIQKKYGDAYKPLICRLHPFYIARCHGEYVVMVEDCDKLCADKVIKNSNISCACIAKNAEEAIDNDFVRSEIGWSKKRLNLEKEILRCSKLFLHNNSYLDFAVGQIVRSREGIDRLKAKGKLLNCFKLWQSFFEVDNLKIENSRLTYELTIMTSLLRTSNFLLRKIKENKVPLALWALYFYMLLYSKDKRLRRSFETYQQILNDVALALLYLSADDLKTRYASFEEKMRYLRYLQGLYLRKLTNIAQANQIGQKNA